MHAVMHVACYTMQDLFTYGLKSSCSLEKGKEITTSSHVADRVENQIKWDSISVSSLLFKIAQLFKLILAVNCGYKSLVVFVLTTINKLQQLIKGLCRKLSQSTILGRSHRK